MKGAACATVAAARRCCFRASASCARLGPRREEPFAAFRWHGGGANEHRRLLPKAVRQFAPPPTPPPADAYYRRPQTYSRLVGLRQIRLVCKRYFFLRFQASSALIRAPELSVLTSDDLICGRQHAHAAREPIRAPNLTVSRQPNGVNRISAILSQRLAVAAVVVF